MSAFTVSARHISAMVNGMRFSTYGFDYYWNGERCKVTTRNELGQKLLDENYRSVNYRYSETDDAPRYKHDGYALKDQVAVIKLCDCYNYQTCESPDWKETEAYAIAQAIRETAIGALPGMSSAEWAI